MPAMIHPESNESGGVRVWQSELPLHMVWLATNACNLRCVHCSSNAARRLAHELSTEEACAMFDDFSATGVLDVAVSGGEPLVRKDLIDVIAHAVNLGISVGVGSNGTSVTETVARRMADAGVDRLQISIDGLRVTHDLARRKTGLFETSVAAIQRGLEAGLRVHVCFTVHHMNAHELPSVIDECASWGVRRFNMSRFVPTGRGTVHLDLQPNQWREVMEVFYVKRDEYRGVMEFTTHLSHQILFDDQLACTPGFLGCQAGRAQGCVGPEGDVSPCVMLPLVVGNIRRDSLRDIWLNSPVLQQLRHREAVKGRCHSCSFRDKCGGCRAVAYSYTGDYLAEDPRCWLISEGPHVKESDHGKEIKFAGTGTGCHQVL